MENCLRCDAIHLTLTMNNIFFRFLPNMSLLKKLIHEKHIGQIKLCDIRCDFKKFLSILFTVKNIDIKALFYNSN